jgi:hypothetical protein
MAEQPLDSFLAAIARENNIPVERIQPILKKLNDEFFYTAGSLNDVTNEEMQGIGIPYRLIDLIRKKLATLQQANSLPATRHDILAKLVSELCTEFTNNDTIKECISTLQLIVFNILRTNPVDDRVRRLKKANPKFHAKVGAHRTAVEYLLKIGFESQGESYYMPSVDFVQLREILEEINEVAENVGLPPKPIPEIELVPETAFDPYKPLIFSRNPDNLKVKPGDNDPIALTKRIQEVQEEKERMLEVRNVDRNVKVFRLSPTGNVQAALRRLQEEEMKRLAAKFGPGYTVSSGRLEDADEEDNKAQLRHIQSVLKANEEMSNFRNKRKMMLENVQKQQVYPTTVIRVRFPDMTLLQVCFASKESTRDVYNFVIECLEQQGRPFHLYLAPPKQVIKMGNQDLRSMAPATLLNFSWNDVEETTQLHGPFLRSDLLAQAAPLNS